MTSAAPSPVPLVLAPEDWRARARAHRERIAARTAPLMARRTRGEPHPVQDFLFGYYTLTPGALQRWHPGAGVVLADDDGAAATAEAAELGTAPRGEWRHWRRVEPGEVVGVVLDGREVGGWTVDVPAFLADRASGVAFTRELLERTAGRPARLGCFGLHEWAMAYRSDVHGVRHSQLPLRLGAAGTDAVVEDQRIRCTHFDAFRFFAPEAVPLNEGAEGVQPTRAGMRDMEQPGCLHAGMDLYKWAHKLLPLVDSDLVADCFDLAWDIRRLDMEASPYDLTGVDDLSDGLGGYTPVRIETPEGRAEYARRQRGFAERGQALRARLLAALEAGARAAGDRRPTEDPSTPDPEEHHG
ncbi:3-methyladenine DNA glycosylase [Micrococcus porci]|uniref:3-methyladenine DNA glycosylase n=1 Tax=Micrococcus porci TaxID=2856555 RepID=UPI001CCC51E6|nr:3-methyladenine DNA glycosylase [Micrococcus porci]UBH24735.1 3-methyladenine DNA glycosylase [Micrococcus porci]